MDLLKNVNIYVVRDSMGPTQKLKVVLKIFKWTNLSAVTQLSWDIEMVSIAAFSFLQAAKKFHLKKKKYVEIAFLW